MDPPELSKDLDHLDRGKCCVPEHFCHGHIWTQDSPPRTQVYCQERRAVEHFFHSRCKSAGYPRYQRLVKRSSIGEHCTHDMSFAFEDIPSFNEPIGD